MLKSVFERSFLHEKRLWKSKFVQNFKKPGGRTDIIFDTCFETFKWTFLKI